VPGSDIGKGGVIRRDHAGAGTGFDAHVADAHAGFHRKPFDGLTAVLQHVAGSAGGADGADQFQDQVLGKNAATRPAGEFHPECPGSGLNQRLGNENMLYL
jgi:hypothetical protein